MFQEDSSMVISIAIGIVIIMVVLFVLGLVCGISYFIIPTGIETGWLNTLSHLSATG
jgi:hypothetical protein